MASAEWGVAVVLLLGVVWCFDVNDELLIHWCRDWGEPYCPSMCPSPYCVQAGLQGTARATAHR